MDLSERKFRILQLIIDDFILTAAPVGSRTISRKAGLGLSSATIRNEMSDLEEMGYLDQPHASAGRVPSNKAFRLYVDHLMRQYPLSGEESSALRRHFEARMDEVGSVLKHAAQVLSDATSYTSLVLPPQLTRLRIRRVQIVPISDTSALIVVVTDVGIMKDAIIRIPEGIEASHLHALSDMLTDQLNNHTLEQLRADFSKIDQAMNVNRKEFMELMDLFDQMTTKSPTELVVGGSANLLAYPEFADVEKARILLKTLDTRTQLAGLLARSTQAEFSITIGPENELPGLQDSSLVTVSYHIGDEKLGSLGIIGPTRMDYSRVLSVLEFMRQMLSEVLGAMVDHSIQSSPPEAHPALPGAAPQEESGKRKRKKGG